MKISTIRKFAKNPFMLCLMVFSILSSSVISTNAAPIAPTTDFSQTDLFNAVYFLDGDLVDQIPTLASIKAKADAQKSRTDRATQATVTKNVNSMDPSFQGRLYKAVKSGDQYTISSTVKEGGELVTIAAAQTLDRSQMKGFPNIEDYNLRNKADRTELAGEIAAYNANNGPDVVAVAILVIAIYYYLALWKLVVIPFTASHDVVFAKAINSDNSISHERFVSELAGL